MATKTKSPFAVDKADHVPGTEGHESQIFEEYLRRNGFKFTATRRQLLASLFEMHDHFTADQLLDRLKQSRVRVSKATVYRTLAVMLDCGLLECHDFGVGSLYYEHSFGHGHHDHLFCLHCKRIVEFRHDGIEQLQEQVARDLGFQIVSHSLKLFGLCEVCRADPESAARYRSRRAPPVVAAPPRGPQ